MHPLDDLGFFIRSARLAQGRTQRELAKLVGTSQAYIDKVEHNQIDPRLSSVVRLLRALDFELTALGEAERTIARQFMRPVGDAGAMLIPEEPEE
jgi:predicted transcriptional regulator